ncbi:MAG TPA: LptA/OstA family protein [Stellaceae bacterium]|nr:LptA/OstA family protein [Stellaceae bacterium]
MIAPWRQALAPALVSAMLFALSASAAPQGPAASGPAAANSLPIEIHADDGIEWQQDARVYIARGNAVAKRGDSEIHADTLIAYYRPSKTAGQNKAADQTAAEGGTEIYRVDADGNVVIKNPSRTVVGDHAVWDVDQAVGVVTGKALKMTTASDTVTARDSLEWYDQKEIGVARGDAVATRGPKTIKADILTIYLVKDTAKPGAKPAAGKPAAAPATPAAAKGTSPFGGGSGDTSKISRVDAQGHVVVINMPDVGHGDYGVYNAETGICTLIGNVVIARDKDVITGQYAIMDLNRNVDRILPSAGVPGQPPQRVQGLFVRQEAAPGATGGKPAAEAKPK